MQNLENTTLGKYELIRLVGKGSMGQVYLGRDPFADRDIAIKVASAESGQIDGSITRNRKLFFNEAKVAGQLRHPNIVAVHDAGVEGDIWYMVMEFVPGSRTLDAHTKPDSLLPIYDVVRLVFKCAKALDYAHRNGVVHRDIKPKNILLTVDNDVRIADFGVALITRHDVTETQVHGYVGSPLYMSPEQIEDHDVSNRSDLFSMGVVLYEMLTGKHPFTADNLGTILYQVTQKPHPPLNEVRPDVPRTLERIVDRCLTKAASDRYGSGLALAGDLSLVFDELKLSEEELSGGDKYNRIKGLRFFNEFSESETWELLNASRWEEYETGDDIVVEGEIDSSFYVIVAGAVDVRKGSRSVDTLTVGDCFGETGFASGERRSAGIVAEQPVTVMKVRSSLIERASLNCQLRFHKVFLNTLVERLSRATDRISQEIRP